MLVPIQKNGEDVQKLHVKQTRTLVKTIHVKPMGKPRQTQRDRWKKRPCVVRYRNMADEIRRQTEGFTFPQSKYHLIFYLPMAKSWPKYKKKEKAGTPHDQKPDKDNLEKAVLDALHEEDKLIWDGRVSKLWCRKGEERIEIWEIKERIYRLP